MERNAVFEPTKLTKPEATGLTNAIQVILEQIQPRYKQLELAHKIAKHAGSRATDRSIRVDARDFEELEAAITELKRWKARLKGEPQ